MQLVLSLFPGIGLLDRAFEEEGFCIVRGPDLLWGGDVRGFHPPAAKFSGVIGGPPCQAFSQLRHIVEANGFKTAPNLIPEFERCVEEAQPDWFLMENVPDAPLPRPVGYETKTLTIRDVWVGGQTNRLRNFTFGASYHPVALAFYVETLALSDPMPEPAVTCDMRRRPVALGGNGKPKRRPNESGGRTSSLNRGYGAETIERMAELQGVPLEFVSSLQEHGAFTASAIKKGIGNGVPFAMGRSVAKAVRSALTSAQRQEG